MKYWKYEPLTLTIWKPIKSINTFVTLITNNVWLADTRSIYFVTCQTFWSLVLTIAAWKLFVLWGKGWTIESKNHSLWQFGNPKYPSIHLSHLSSIMFDLQTHLPFILLHVKLFDPSFWQLQPENYLCHEEKGEILKRRTTYFDNLENQSIHQYICHTCHQ